MKYSIKAIETEYKGYKFRSRLEAKWAAFFDYLEWKWEYEPIEFDGWIPDFVIYGKEPIYVEVKPVIEFPQTVFEKIVKSGCNDEFLIVGQTFPISMSSNYLPCIGWLAEKFPRTEPTPNPIHLKQGLLCSCDNCWQDTFSYWWDKAIVGKWQAGGGKFGFCHNTGSFADRISGGYDGGCNGELWENEDEERIKRIWALACNEVRWEK
jgi:hypothetical protein